MLQRDLPKGRLSHMASTRFSDSHTVPVDDKDASG